MMVHNQWLKPQAVKRGHQVLNVLITSIHTIHKENWKKDKRLSGLYFFFYFLFFETPQQQQWIIVKIVSWGTATYGFSQKISLGTVTYGSQWYVFIRDNVSWFPIKNVLWEPWFMVPKEKISVGIASHSSQPKISEGTMIYGSQRKFS